MPLADEVLQCFALPTDWDLNDDFDFGGIYMPYSWASEWVTQPESDATDIKSSVYFVNSLSAGIFQWGLTVAGFLFCIILGMFLSDYLSEKDSARNNSVWKDSKSDKNVDEWSYVQSSLHAQALYDETGLNKPLLQS